MGDKLPERKRLRLRKFDYNTPGAYFITVCTNHKKCTLSRIVGAIHESPVTQLTEFGKIVNDVIKNIPKSFTATVDRYVIMPNHIHLIVVVKNSEELRAIRESPLHSRSVISNLIGYIKMNASKEIHKQDGAVVVWQRGFHDHIIRSRQDYEKISQYIHENPIRWKFDCFYTED